MHVTACADGKLKPVADDAPARIDEWPLIVFHIPERMADQGMKTIGDVVDAAIAAAKGTKANEDPAGAQSASSSLADLRDTFKAGLIHASAEHGEAA